MVAGRGVSDARTLAKDLVESLGRRWAHVQGVAWRAGRLADVLLEPKDREVVVTAAWLHDIGYSSAVADTGLHPLDGARYLQKLGWFDPVVTGLVAYHTGAQVEAEERGLIEDLCCEFSRPSEQLLDVVTTADLLTSPDGQPVSPRDRVQEILSRYSSGDPVHRAVSRSGPGLIERADSLITRLTDVRSGSAAIEGMGDT